jgi:hypothetical protein
LKSASRALYETVWQARKALGAETVDLDRLHGELGALQWEKKHLLRELALCLVTKEADKLEYKVADDAILDESDFEARTEHALKRVKQEHEFRVHMSSQVAHLGEAKTTLNSQLNASRALLDGMPQQASSVAKSLLTLQAFLGVDVSERLQRHAAVKQLPTPLYVAYCQLEAHADSFGGVELSVDKGAVRAKISSMDESSCAELVIQYLVDSNELEMSNAAGSNSSNIGEAFSENPALGGRFRFLQNMGGLYRLDPDDKSYVPPSTHAVVTRIREWLLTKEPPNAKPGDR